MTESINRAKVIKNLIEGEATNRGAVLGVLVKAFVDQYGPEAIDIARKAIFDWGEIQGKALASKVEEKGIIEFRHAIATAPNELNPFDPEEVELSEEKAVIRIHSCPLYEAWKGLGYSEAFMKTLCDIAMDRDFGNLKGFGGDLKLEIKKQLAYGDKYCELIFQKE
jgi:hypothetical protein